MSVVALPPARFTPKQRATLAVLLGAGFLLSIDFSILNVALPQVGTGVGLDLTSLPWISTAFVLPAAGFTLVCGRLADLVGRRRLFRTGMALLAAGSLLGGFAANPELLLAARALQGFATAMTLPAALSLLTTTFAEGAGRDRVLGLNGASAAGSSWPPGWSCRRWPRCPWCSSARTARRCWSWSRPCSSGSSGTCPRSWRSP
jgi:MFS family permease